MNRQEKDFYTYSERKKEELFYYKSKLNSEKYTSRNINILDKLTPLQLILTFFIIIAGVGYAYNILLN
ncbi:MAG: hypothetical protein RSC24_06490 [Clostridium sp.]